MGMSWQRMKRKLKKLESENRELERGFDAIRTVAFMPNVSSRDIQEEILEQDYLRALRAEPLF